MQNKSALEIINRILARQPLNIKSLLPSARQMTYSVLRWIFDTGSFNDGINEQHDEVIDTVALLLIKSYEDKTILPTAIDMIFDRHSKGTFTYDLIWAVFESRDPQILLMIAYRLLSPRDEDFELASKLLKFIPYINGNKDRQQQYSCCINWIYKNYPFLYYTGESFQQTYAPVPFAVPLKATNVCPKYGRVIKIKKTNPTLNVDSLATQYPPESVEAKMLHILSSSSTVYNYDSIDQLKFEIDLRTSIINASKELHESDFSFKIFRKSICNEDYWKRTDSGGFLLKEGIKPSDAINDIYINSSKYGTECATAMVIVFYKAILDIFPQELFSKLFPNIHLMNWQHLDSDLGVNYHAKSADYLPGDCRYFKNPDVNPETPEWQGENAIDMGDGTYYGHGIGIKTADGIIESLNKHREESSQTSAYLTDSVTRLNFKYLANKYLSFTSGSQ